MMRAIEFKSKIRENRILIPRRMQSELLNRGDKKVRVVVFLEDGNMTKSKVLNGYAGSDFSTYDFIPEKSAEQIIAEIQNSRSCGNTRIIEHF